MKYCKILLILVIVLCCSGCSVNYNLSIDKGEVFNEKVSLIANYGSDVEEISNFNMNIPISKDVDDKNIFMNKIKGVKYYNQSKDSNKERMSFSYRHNFTTFQNDYISNSSYKYVTIYKKENNLILSTSNTNLAFEKYDNLDKVVVTIRSRYRLIDTNADKKENYKYIWEITRENYSNKYIYLSLDMSNHKDSFWEKLEGIGFFKYFWLIVIVISIIIFVFLFFKYSKKRDQI